MSAAGAALALALAAGAAMAQDGSRAEARTYVCEAGAVLRAAYLAPSGGDPMAVVDWAGQLVPMGAVPTASGAAYADIDDRRGLRWRTKGDVGTLSYLPPEDGAEEIVLLEGCEAAAP